MKKNIIIKKSIPLLIIIAILIIQILSIFNIEGKSSKKKYSALLEEAMYNIRKLYIDKSQVSYKNLIHGAIKGMLESLKDKHSVFLNETEYKNLKNSINQEFTGLGIKVSFLEDFPKIIAVIQNTPAEKAGLKTGDYIIEIEGKSTKNIKGKSFIKKTKGKIGSTIKIKIGTQNLITTKTIKLTRQIIKTDTVKSKMLKNKIAYIKIKSFSENTLSKIKEDLKSLKSKGMKKIILDVRNNPGGLLKIAIKISNIFLNKELIIVTKGRDPKSTKKFYANKKDNLVNKSIPIILLVNKASASASEILAASLQDNKRGIIIGEKTFGKGSIQNIIKLFSSQEKLAMRITTSEYFSPLMKKIHNQGVIPDILIKENPKSPLEIYMENMLINKNYIKRFLMSKPNYKEKDIENFIKYLAKEKIIIKKEVLKFYIEKIKDIQNNKIVNIKYDKALKKAIEILKQTP